MGYGIVPGYRGRGLATEAARAVLDWTERHDIDVYSSIRPPNPASVRVLGKIGMRLVESYVDEDGQRDIYRRLSDPVGGVSNRAERAKSPTPRRCRRRPSGGR
jgi:RimJ/RimL family protein N-acetyltransferase